MKPYALFAAALLFLASTATPSVTQQPPQSDQLPMAHEHHAMHPPTNLQVLPKDISHEDLMKLMHSYTGALGVHCSFCHMQDPATHHMDFASDAKPEKGFARIMIKMTRNINAEYLTQIHDPDATPEQKEVTCGTCHRGMMMPEPFIPKPETHQPDSH
jgi:hypothetical protein